MNIHVQLFSVYGQNTYGIDCGKEANEWFSNFLNKPNMRLLFFHPAMQKRLAKGGFFGEVGISVPDNAQVKIYSLFNSNKRQADT